MTAATYWAAIDPETYAVHGIGLSPDAAAHDAEADGCTGVEGLSLVPCTTAAYVYVTEHGGAPSSNLTVSRDGVCLRAEED